MADREYRQISDLPTGITPITGAEIVELEQDGVSRKFSMVALSGVVAEHEDKHQFGGDDPVGTHDLVANAIPYLDADGTIDSRVSDASTTVKGKVLLAEDGGTDAGAVVQATDGRLTDARDPTEHASTHMPDSTDPIALATTSAPGLMGNGDKTKLDSIDTSLLLTTAQKGALAGSYGTPGPDNVFVTDNDPRVGGEGPDITDLVNWAAFTDVPWVEKHAGYTSSSGTLRYIIEWDSHVFLLPTNGKLSWWDGSTVTEVTGQSAGAYWEGAAIFEDKLYVISSVDITSGTLNEVQIDGDGYKVTLRKTLGGASPRSIGSFDGYLFVGNVDGTINRYSSGLTTPTSITGITGKVVELIECSGVFYAFTRGTSTGSIYVYDSVTESFSSLSLVETWTSAFVQDDTLYGLTGGVDGNIYEIDPATPAITAKNLTARNRVSGCVTASGDVLVVAYLDGSYVVSELETVTTPSINISLSDVKVNLPSTLPIGSRKVIRKLGDDAAKYIGIYPPAGTTIEGLTEYRLYEQYASVTIERVSETVFAIVGEGIQKITEVGKIEAFCCTLPKGFKACDGSAISRATFPALFSAVGTTFGAGDGSTTFNLPDARETVLVGTGTRGAGVTSHDTYTLGQFKDDQMQGHWHGTTLNSGGASASYQWSTQIGSGLTSPSTTIPLGYTATHPISDGTNGTPRTGSTTHGKQLGVNYAIRYA